MELIDTKCPNCGSAIKINASEKTGVCEHCNSKFYVDEEVNITNNYIIKNDFGDDVLFNEVDKYLAQLELNNFESLAEIVENLKSKFPHKGIARIVILHYQYITLIMKYGDEKDFEAEVEKMDKCATKYKPKSYKHTPKFSKYIENDIVEIKYAEDINSIITETEKTKYESLIERTNEYTETYIAILNSNKKMLEKFAPYQKKFAKMADKAEKKAGKKGNLKSKIASILVIIGLIAVLVFIYKYFQK